MARLSHRIKSKQSQHLDRWLVSYADYMTLMFALFVVLYAMAVVKEDNFDVLSESLGEIFHLKGEEGTGTTGTGELKHQVSQQQSQQGNDLLPEKGPEQLENNLTITQQTNKKLGKPLAALRQDLETALKQLVDAGIAKLDVNDDWLTIELSSGLLFGSGSATANLSAEVVVEEVAKVLAEVNNYIQVRGYTDDLAINNELFSSNWELSAARAAVVTGLLNRYGVAQERLAIEANGANQPVASNETAEGRARNRRVVVALSKFAFQQNAETDENKTKVEQQITGTLGTELPEYNEIKVIRLPNGGIRITTRQEADDETLEQERIDNNN